MSIPNFPEIEKPHATYDESPEDAGLCSNMEDGSQRSRARFTKSRLSFTLRWNALSAADKGVLLDFYRHVIKGSSQIFAWTHPDPASEFYNQTFYVRCAKLEKFTKVPPDRWSAEMTLKEA